MVLMMRDWRVAHLEKSPDLSLLPDAGLYGYGGRPPPTAPDILPVLRGLHLINLRMSLYGTAAR